MGYVRSRVEGPGPAWPVGMRRMVITGALAVIAITVYLSTQERHSAQAQVVGDVAILMAAGIATLACARAAARRTPASRGWTILALATLLWSLGQFAWTMHGLTTNHAYLFPSLADVGYLGYSIPAAAALLAFPRPPSTVMARWRQALDALVIVLGVLIISWVFVLKQVVAAGGLNTLAGLTGLAYPVVDVIICSIIFTLGMRQPPGSRLPWLLLGGGLLTLAVSDSLYVRLLFENQTALTATPLAAGWMSAFLLLAAATQAPVRPRRPSLARSSTLAVELIPYLPVLGATIVIGFVADHSPFLIAAGTALLVCVGLRQVLIVFENVTLTRTLEVKVAKRTAELNALASIVTTSSEAIVGVSLDGIITSWNPAAERLYGHRSVDVVNRPPTFLSAAHQRGLTSILNNARQGRILAGYETEWPRPEGDGTFPVAMTVSLISDHTVQGVSFFGRDVTEHHRAAQVLEGARRDALESLRLKSEFLAVMSHEIRTPMNGVIGLSSLLLQTPLDAVQRQYAQGVHGAGEALLDVINDILDFSKLEAGKVELDVAEFDPRRLVEEVGGLLAPTAHVKELELLAYCLPGVPISLRGDAGRIRQILLNLASNAVKFTARGEVAIRLSCSDTEDGRVVVRVEVSDTGIGIAEIDLGKLFQSFSQADASTTRQFGGTGLGLAISRRLVEAMDGRIGVNSVVGTGSTFWFEIPLTKAGENATVRERPDSLVGLRALVVDDNATNRQILEAQLESWKLIPDLVEDAPSALRRLRQRASEGRPYDIAVLDMCMPGMDGVALVQSISADPHLQHTRMILLTSSCQMDPAVLREAGVRHWLTKPVKSSELYDRLMRLMTPASPTPQRETVQVDRSVESARTKGRILVVEDNPLNQLVAQGVLTHLGYDVEIAVDGVAAVRAVHNVTYAGVLMDCHMPNMDGFEATRAIRRGEGGGRRVPIIAMTAGAMAPDRERCLAAGMDDFIAKPVDVHTLRDLLDQWVTVSSSGATEQRLNPTLTSRAADLIEENAPATLDQKRVAVLRDLGPDNDTQLFAAIVEAFSRSATSCLAALRRGSMARSDEDLQRAAHELRGASLNVGATRAVALCHDLESAEHGIDSERTMQLLDCLEVELTRVELALDRALSLSA